VTSLVDESRAARLARRSVTIPLWLVALLASVAALPLLLPVALALDVATDRRLPRTRCVLLAVAYLGCEALGMLVALVLWPTTLGDHARMLRVHRAAQDLWASALLAAGRRLFSMQLAVEGEEALHPGPFLLLSRHTSIADTLLPAVLVGRRQRIALRWVMKRELLIDPCLDLFGQRLPNVFIRRGSGEAARELAAIRALASDLGTDEAVLLYPEGTRFTPRARERAQAAVARSDTGRAARVAGLRRVLPPRLGGVLTLLDACPGTDVVLLAHAGFDGISHVRDLWHGGLLGRTVRVRFRRIPASTIPVDAADRARWLDELWASLDAWVTTVATPPLRAIAGGGARHSGPRRQARRRHEAGSR
jgi:1-acyl-sn-glycerol-3-phosphate acyltransferase